MQNYTRNGLKIVGNRSYGLINLNFKYLVQIIFSEYRGGQESIYSWRAGLSSFGAAFQPVLKVAGQIFDQPCYTSC